MIFGEMLRKEEYVFERQGDKSWVLKTYSDNNDIVDQGQGDW